MPVSDTDLSSLYEGGPPPPAADGLHIRFFEASQKDDDATAKAGRPIFVKVEKVEIRIPGDKTNAPVKLVSAEHRERWPKQYAAWKAGLDQSTADGTPLEAWPGVDVAQVDTLRAVKVRTVEHMAGMSDATLGELGPGWRPVRQAAQDWLAAAKQMAPITAVRAENEELRAQLQAAQKTLEDQGAAIRELQKGAAPVAAVVHADTAKPQQRAQR
jgi:hypothetical protein